MRFCCCAESTCGKPYSSGVAEELKDEELDEDEDEEEEAEDDDDRILRRLDRQARSTQRSGEGAKQTGANRT